MAINILMPKLSFIVTEGTIIEWLKEPGDQVSKGEILLIIESEKATVEVESPGAGILGPDLAPVGTTVPVTTTIGYILEPGEEPPRLELDLVESVRDEPDAEPSPTEREGQRAEKRRKISPSARRLASSNKMFWLTWMPELEPRKKPPCASPRLPAGWRPHWALTWAR